MTKSKDTSAGQYTKYVYAAVIALMGFAGYSTFTSSPEIERQVNTAKIANQTPAPERDGNPVLSVFKGRLSPALASAETLTDAGSRDFRDFSIDDSKTLVDLNDIISGGPSKDGIPSLVDPKFVPIRDARVTSNDELGLLVDINGDQRWYGYNILIYHEIANDTVGDVPVAVTFCPLCGSGIVFDRRVDGQTLEFGVSGLLRESNMLMYDRSEPEQSLWQQSVGRAVTGSYVGTELEIVAAQRLRYQEVVERYPEAQALSEDTGYSRDYEMAALLYIDNRDYDQITTFFPVANPDIRLPDQEIMYVVRIGNNQTITFNQLGVENNQQATFEYGSQAYNISKVDHEIHIELDGKKIPGYYEMWYSWATQHPEIDEIVIDLSTEPIS